MVEKREMVASEIFFVVALTGLVDKLDIECDRKTGVKSESQVLGLSNWVCSGAISQNREDWGAMTGWRRVVQHQDISDGCVKLEMPLVSPWGCQGSRQIYESGV